MLTLSDLLVRGPSLTVEDLAQIAAQLSGLVRYGHEMGATHGDISGETVLLDHQGDRWSVSLDQPRSQMAGGVTPTPEDDVLALGQVIERLSHGLPREVDLPDSFAAAFASMTASNAADRPTAAQVETYFAQDFLAAAAAPQQVAPGTARHETSDNAEQTMALPAGYVADPPGDDPASTAAESRSGRSAILIAAVVLLLLVVPLGYVALRNLGPEQEPSTAQPPPSAPDTPADELPVEEEEPATETSQPEDLAGPSPSGPDAAPTGPDVAAPSEESTTGESSGPAEPVDSSTPSTAPAAPTTAPPAPSTDHTDPQWAAHGWDVQALDSAYCRDGSRFIGLADTDTYRGVICWGHFGVEYRGMNKAANATILAPAEATSRGWVGFGPGGVRYELDPDTFTILDGNGRALDEEAVNLWLSPETIPFRPGDLDLDQPISYPSCDGRGVVVHSSHYDPPTDARAVQAMLDATPGSFYTRTDLSCDNFNRPSREITDGNYIYAVLTYGGDTEAELCRSVELSGGGYGYFLREGVEPGLPVECD